ncbi:phosphonate ABC transporter, permease protein PhnE [Geminicoccaceae bacterium 1502E]|nr:phosphonate ABC transporter, permease protein PhnE [Geminicoccaceae bacterium 1502E]
MSMTIAAAGAAVPAARERHPEVFAAAARRKRRFQIALLVLAAYLAWSCWLFEITPARVFGGLDKMAVVLRQMVVWKDMASWDYAGIFEGLAQTLAMAFLGTLVAALVAVPLGFLGARNVNGVKLLRWPVRRLFDLLRGIDTLVWALVFVRAVGLGPLAGVLAIMTSDTGTLGKLYAEAVENVDRKPMEGVRATGAGALQELRFGALPQVLPVFLSQALYFFESNTRSATVLGVVGAGGIGLQLSDRIRVQYWDQACFIIVLILVTVAVIDFLSRKIRERFIGTSNA